MALKSWTSGEIATAYNPICNDAKAIITTGLKMEYELLPAGKNGIQIVTRGKLKEAVKVDYMSQNRPRKIKKSIQAFLIPSL